MRREYRPDWRLNKIVAIMLNPRTNELLEVWGERVDEYYQVFYDLRGLDGFGFGEFTLEPSHNTGVHLVYPTQEDEYVAARFSRFHTPGGIQSPEHRGQGYGSVMYLAGAVLATRHKLRHGPALGICSVRGAHEKDDDHRSDKASKTWTSLVRHGLAERTKQLDYLRAVKVLRSGLVVAYAGQLSDDDRTPASLVTRTRIRTKRQVQRTIRILENAYPPEVAQAFMGRADVQRILKGRGGTAGLGAVQPTPLPPLTWRAVQILRKYRDLI